MSEREEERAVIVKWLRDEAGGQWWSVASAALRVYANAIERGDHLKDKDQ